MATVAARAAGRHGFDQVVAGVIIANAVILVASLIVDGHEQLFEVLHNLVLEFFIFELLARLRDVGWRLHALLRRPWNTFDVVIIALSFLPVLGDASLLRVARLARVVHLMRHASHLRPSRLLVR